MKKRRETYNSHQHIYSYEDKKPWKPTSLKQKALWAAALVFWLIAACTLFSTKNQEQMTPQVTTVKAETNYYSSSSPAKLPLDCLQLDSEGWMHLYEIYEGTGWEAGTRVREVQGFSMDKNYVLLEYGGWGEYVQYTSNTLAEGELVDVVRGGGKRPDRWLAVFPDAMPEIEDLPYGVEILGQQGKALLLSVEADNRIFMEGRAKSLVPELSGARVYSLADIEQFLGNFICFGLLLAVFAIVFTLWGYAWYENQYEKKYPRMWPMSLGISILLLVGIAAILHFVSLPSSLLPPEHITDLGYYLREFLQAFEALNQFAGQVEGIDALLTAQLVALFCSLGILALGGGLAYLIMRWEEFLMEERIVRKIQRGDWY